MNSVRSIQQLNKRELEAGTPATSSWHTDYRDTAFIYIGGLPFELSEGDVITIASQYGEPVWIKLARDRETGKSRGFAWIKYEDQRSCDLAVDNLGGSTVMDRVLRVDHTRYKPKDDEDMRDNTMGELDLTPEDEDRHGGRRKRRKTESESGSEDEERPLLPEEIELGRLMEKLDVDDPMREAMLKSQQDKVDEAVRKMKRRKQKEKEKEKREERRHRRDGSRERDKDRKRIKERGEDHNRDDRRRRHSRSRERERDAEGNRHHKSSKHRSRSREKHRRERRNRSEDSEGSDRDQRQSERRRRSRSRDERRHRHSERSPSPYRRRSPRRHRD